LKHLSAGIAGLVYFLSRHINDLTIGFKPNLNLIAISTAFVVEN
jgi:hypothetical protein